MNRVFISIVTVFFVIAALAIFQATRETSAAALVPSDLVASKVKSMPRVHVGGRVTNLPIEYTVQPEIKLTFSIVNPGPPNPDGSGMQPIHVVYRGLKPDMFTAGRDVIIDGEFKDGELIASSLLTQCPSKYEAAVPKAEQSTGKN